MATPVEQTISVPNLEQRSNNSKLPSVDKNAPVDINAVAVATATGVSLDAITGDNRAAASVEPRAALSPESAWASYIASVVNKDPGVVEAFRSVGGPFDARPSPNKNMVAFLNGLDAQNGAATANGTLGQGKTTVADFSLVFSGTNLTPKNDRVEVQTASLNTPNVAYAPLTYVQDNQINFNVPATLPSNAAPGNFGESIVSVHVVRNIGNGKSWVYPGKTMTVLTNGAQDMLPLTPAAISNPDIYSFASLAQKNLMPALADHSDGRPVLPNDPAIPGQQVSLYVTGLTPAQGGSYNIRIRNGQSVSSIDPEIRVATSDVKDLGSGVYKITFFVPNADQLNATRAIYPDGRTEPGNPVYSAEHADKVKRNWNLSRQGTSPETTPISGILIQIDAPTSNEYTYNQGVSRLNYLPVNTKR